MTKILSRLIKNVIRSTIWSVYYLFYLMPLDCYFRIKSFLKLSKEVEYQGNSKLHDKICIFASYPLFGQISKSLTNYLLSLSELGYSIYFISNRDIETKYIEELRALCAKIVIRENFGKDFGAYKAGIIKYKTQISNPKSVLIANDSVIQIADLKKMFDDMNSKNIDFWGVSEAYHGEMYRNHHICSYFLVVSQKIIKSRVFWNFWENYKLTQSRVNIIQYGEIGFSLAMRGGGFSMQTYINSSSLYNFILTKENYLPSVLNWLALERSAVKMDVNHVIRLLYTVNHNGIFLKIMLQLCLPLIKKDIFSKCYYYLEEIAVLLRKQGVTNTDEVIKELLDQIKPIPTSKDKILKFIGEK